MSMQKWIPQRLTDVGTTVSVVGADGSQHELLVGERVEVEANVDTVGKRDERHLEAVRLLVSANDQRLDNATDELDNSLEVLACNATRRVYREHDVYSAGRPTP